MRLSIVIPAYNEQDRIIRTLSETCLYLADQPYLSEIVVISDGSTDKTVEVASSFSKDKGVVVRALEYHPNKGKGYAVRFGMLKAKAERILFMDADYAVPIAHIEKAHAQLDKGYDIAIASRALAESEVSIHQGFAREISAKIYKLVQNLSLGISYPDTQCGFKMFTKKAAHDLFSRQKLDSVIFDPEILWLAKKAGYKVGQFPVKWSHVEDSRIVYDSIGKSLFVFKELFRIKKLHKQDDL